MSMKEIQQCARQAGLPFAGKNITPLLVNGFTNAWFLRNGRRGIIKDYISNHLLLGNPVLKLIGMTLLKKLKS